MPAKRGERPVRSQRSGRAGRENSGRENSGRGKSGRENSGRESEDATRNHEPLENEEDEQTTAEPADENGAGELTVATAAQEGRRLIAAVTNKNPEGVTSVEPTENGWVIEVEVLEDRHIPSSSDVLALYEVEVDGDGELLSYRRTQRYPRGRSMSSNGGE